ncbi:MAG: DUF1203 domain-containing protein [Acidimicrobiia bacterium]
MTIEGLDPQALHDLRTTAIDHGGNTVEPFIDADGGWPLRCCLTDSARGDELAIVAWSPFPWRGPYRETGPIVIHARPCAGADGTTEVPSQFLGRRQLLRPYGHDRRIAYDHVVIVEPDGSLPSVLGALLGNDEIDFVHVRNVNAGCYSFTARRGPRLPERLPSRTHAVRIGRAEHRPPGVPTIAPIDI